MSGIVSDKRMPLMFNVAVHISKTAIRPVILYGSETWALRKNRYENPNAYNGNRED